jgi:regulator of sirC expression with transglutaminase-like and TPR domain
MRLRTESTIDSSAGQFQSEHSIIRVYRRHAARAISEERWQVAEIFFDRILDISPELTEAWLMKGFLRQYCREDEHGAICCYRKVIDLCGDNSTHPHAQRARASLAQLQAA